MTLEALRGRLIVSVQAEAGSALDDPATIVRLARAVLASGAAAVRIEGLANLRAVRAAVAAPIVGLIKRRDDGFEPYITTTRADVEALVAAGADVVAFDATGRLRPGGASVPGLIARARELGALAMADCSDASDGAAAVAAGADLVASTLAGYTAATAGRVLPALDLVAALAGRHPFVVCEGGIASPADARAAFAAGAAAIVVGTAITNVDALARRFAAATPARDASEAQGAS